MPAQPASSIYLGCLQHGVRASLAPERGAPNPPEEPGAAPSPHHPLGTVLGHGDSPKSWEKVGNGKRARVAEGEGVRLRKII